MLFRGDTQLNETLMNLNTPKKIFDYFFDENIINNIIAETNLFSAQKDITRPPSVTGLKIQQFLGICILTLFHSLPSLRRYWSLMVGSSLVQSTMTCNRYEINRKELHFNNNNDMVPKATKIA
jgi:hypothetical protein